MKLGINLIVAIDRDKKNKIITRSKTPTDGLCWTSNIRAEKVGIDHNLYLYRDFNQYIIDQSDNDLLTLVKIKQFRANDRRTEEGDTVAGVVNPHELYNLERKKSVFVLFHKDKAGRRLLLTVGSKSIKEFRAVGHDMYQHSEVPLLVCIKDKKFEQINLL
jgi:hypothetical protein